MLKLSKLTWQPPEGGQIIKGMDLSIPDGKLVVLTGPNGGGKTTLAKLIAGLETPHPGRYSWTEKTLLRLTLPNAHAAA